MFSGIIETIGRVAFLKKERNNLHITIEASFAKKLKVDQSVSHNGVCLTVVKKGEKNYTVTAIKETLDKTNLGSLKIGDGVNLERAMKLGDRIDGHIVQGHVDTKATCQEIKKEGGSWLFKFSHGKNSSFITTRKGSVCVNGISLTVVESTPTRFSVAVIPYTFENTNLKNIKSGQIVNIEFDILGKYIASQLKIRL
jgi:riboflavin synthase